jgi:hypothetical protein
MALNVRAITTKSFEYIQGQNMIHLIKKGQKNVEPSIANYLVYTQIFFKSTYCMFKQKL